jgi:AraC-like DNA-binding protein
MARPKTDSLVVDSFDGVSKIWHTPFKQDNVRDFHQDPLPEMGADLPMRIDFVHEEHCFENYYRRREHSELFSIELVLEGSMLFVQDGRKYQVMPGEVYLVHLDRNNEFTTGPEKQCHRLACVLTGKSLNSLLHATGLFECDVIKLQPDSPVEQLMRDCLDEFKQMRPKFRRRASLLSYELLLELSANLEHTHGSELLNRAIEIMEHHLSQRLTLKRLAELLGSSRSSLNRSFQARFQESPINYFIRLKIEAAKSLLAHTGLRIQEIARRVGYDNPLYFSSEFKKRVGQSPRQYRKERQKASGDG